MATKKFELPVPVHPGATLREWLEENWMDGKELATRTGKPEKTISNILNGKSAITPEMAGALELATGVSASVWGRLQSTYDEATARLQKRSSYDYLWGIWGCLFPFAQMVKLGWIADASSNKERVDILLRFFGIASEQAYAKAYTERMIVGFRVSGGSERSSEAISAWVRRGEIMASGVPAVPYNRQKAMEAIPTLKLAVHANNPTRLAQECAKVGIKLVYVENLPKASMSGAALWASGVPIILLSGKGKSHDKFAFNFFHELGHILLHAKGERKIYVDEGQLGETGKETEADAFASETLIPHEQMEAFACNEDFTLPKIRAFAENCGVQPCIVVGRLTHINKIDYAQVHTRYKRFALNIELFARDTP